MEQRGLDEPCRLVFQGMNIRKSAEKLRIVNNMQLTIPSIFMKSIRFIFMLMIIFSPACLVKSVFNNAAGAEFDPHRAYRDIERQLSFGSRAVGTPGHRQARKWIMEVLRDAGWQVELQNGEMMGHRVQNIIAFREKGEEYILLGAHYDTRLFADQDSDPERRNDPVPGANDGASGVAVLLEIARIYPEDTSIPVQFVFFDAEDNGDIPGWDWILGSRMFVEEMKIPPRAVIILDMVGDGDLNLHYEKTSHPRLRKKIWDTAAVIGYEGYFIPTEKHALIDDHTPFLNQGFPAVDIIDFDYPYWHTTSDTLDKVSPESLKVVGETVLQWLMEQDRLEGE